MMKINQSIKKSSEGGKYPFPCPHGLIWGLKREDGLTWSRFSKSRWETFVPKGRTGRCGKDALLAATTTLLQYIYDLFPFFSIYTYFKRKNNMTTYICWGFPMARTILSCLISKSSHALVLSLSRHLYAGTEAQRGEVIWLMWAPKHRDFCYFVLGWNTCPWKSTQGRLVEWVNESS